jgi:hypothetical protein
VGCVEIVVSGLTVSCALLDVTEPQVADTTTEYCPGSLKLNEGMVKVDAVAPEIGEPFLRHW